MSASWGSMRITKDFNAFIFAGVVAIMLYLWYYTATYTGPSGPTRYATGCSFWDWLTRNCTLPYTNNGGIGVA